MAQNQAIYELVANVMYGNNVSLGWKVNKNIVLPGDVFEIHRGNSPEQFELLQTNLTLNMYKDSTVNLYSFWRIFYYKIIVKRLSSASNTYVKIYETVCTLQIDQQDAVTREISRRRELVNRQYAKNIGNLFIRKTFGERCTHCYDADFMASTDDECPYCYSTTIAGGYFIPSIEVSYSTGTAPKQDSDTEPTLSQVENMRFTIPGYPFATPGDIFVDRHRNIWTVESLTYSKLNGSYTMQELYCSRTNYGEVEYKLLEHLKV